MVAFVVAATVEGDAACGIPPGADAVFLEEAVVVGLLGDAWGPNSTQGPQPAQSVEIALPVGPIPAGVEHPVGDAFIGEVQARAHVEDAPVAAGIEGRGKRRGVDARSLNAAGTGNGILLLHPHGRHDREILDRFVEKVEVHHVFMQLRAALQVVVTEIVL